MRLPKIERDTVDVLCLKCGMGQSTPNCPTCGQQMNSLFNGRKTTYICARCEQDPLKSPKVQKLIRAVKPPKDEPQDPLPD
jgi:tRNA(Ile2) C34 agmatinyltransferase TiaS